MEILLEDVNYIALESSTLESLKGHTMQDLIEQVKDTSTPVTFAIAEKIEDGIVTVGNYEPQFTLSAFNNEGSNKLKIDCSLYVFDARKYYEGVVDVDVLHTALRKIAAEKQLVVKTDDDEPAFYNTYIDFNIGTSRETPIESFISYLKKEAADIYLDGKRKAVDEQIQLLKEYRETI